MTYLLRILGLLAMTGSFLYAVGDVLLLASKVNLDEYPKLKPFVKLLDAVGDVLLLTSKVNLDEYPKLKPFVKLFADAEKMVVLSPKRMMWGALLGVFATPLVLAGYWQIYRGLTGANPALVLTTVVLFTCASVIGAFVHGTFYYLGEYVLALNNVDEQSQTVIADMLTRHRKVLIISYAPVIIMVVIASILFSVLVATQKTAFPVWIAATNPLILIIAWLILERVLPRFIRDWTKGAGFNIAFLIFFVITTSILWNV
jgi:hypothetical protein